MKVTNTMKMENLKMNQIMLKRAKKFIQSLNLSQTLKLTIHAMFLLWKGLIIKVMTVLVSLIIFINCKKWPNCELQWIFWPQASTPAHFNFWPHAHRTHVCFWPKSKHNRTRTFCIQAQFSYFLYPVNFWMLIFDN